MSQRLPRFQTGTQDSSRAMNRRVFLWTSASAAAGFAFLGFRKFTAVRADEAAASGVRSAASGTPGKVNIVEFSDDGRKLRAVSVPKIVKTEGEWRKQLSPISFEVTRHDDTEIAFTGAYWNNHEKGLYRCICCDTALFSSDTKFDSGTGWPSFWAPIAKQNIEEHTDLGLGVPRIAISCRRCDAHLGHVFDDGPPPTGLRYCMNSVALRFVKFA